MIRFDEKPPIPLPSTRPGTIAGALPRSAATHPEVPRASPRNAIAAYNDVNDQVVLGTRRRTDPAVRVAARARQHDRRSGRADLTALPHRRELGPRSVTSTRCSRSPVASSRTGELRPLPDARRSSATRRTRVLAETVPLLDDGVIGRGRLQGVRPRRSADRLRASLKTAAELRPPVAAPVTSRRASPRCIVVRPVIEERERRPPPSARSSCRPRLERELLFARRSRRPRDRCRQGLVVRAYDDGIRVTIRDQVDDDYRREWRGCSESASAFSSRSTTPRRTAGSTASASSRPLGAPRDRPRPADGLGRGRVGTAYYFAHSSTPPTPGDRRPGLRIVAEVRSGLLGVQLLPLQVRRRRATSTGC